MEVLESWYGDSVQGCDLGLPPGFPTRYGVLHCCLPYSDRFEFLLGEYIDLHGIPGALVIVHSTVPLGTTAKVLTSAVHSPIRGVHPNIANGIRTFVKYFGGPRAKDAAKIFKALCPTKTTELAATTEALKLWDTTYYGWNIVFEKAVNAYCEEHGLDFDIVYAHANNTYNLGFEKLGNTDVQRPVLQHKPGPIGGHCVLPNAELLGGDVADFILTHKE